jgi:hypothetical protein
MGVRHTQAWSKQSDVEIGDKFLRIGIKHAHPGSDVARKTDTNYLENCFKYEKHQLQKGRMAVMGIGDILQYAGAQALCRLSDKLARCQKLGALKRSGRCKKGHRRRELYLL